MLTRKNHLLKSRQKATHRNKARTKTSATKKVPERLEEQRKSGKEEQKRDLDFYPQFGKVFPGSE